MNSYDTDLALATFRSGAADSHLFLVQGWRGQEGVSQLYRFEVDLASAQDDINLAQLLGSRSTLTLRNEAGELIPWHGLITELHQTHRDETYAYYRAVLEPQLALLSLFKQSRVYVHSNNSGGGDPDLATIIRTTLKQCGLIEEGASSNTGSSHYEIRVNYADLKATQSNFICQFEETTLNFLMRRLEQAGVYFWFEQNENQECIVFANRTEQQALYKKTMVWRPAKGLNTAESDIAINRFEHSVTVQPKGVVLRDFSVSQPNLNLTVQANVTEEAPATDRFNIFGNIEVYGAHYSKQSSGDRLAALQAEEIACQRNRYTGEALSIGLQAGVFVEMQQHFRSDLNQLYYVVTVKHEGKQSLPRQSTEQSDDSAFYHAYFTVLPATLQFRAPRAASQPRVIGFVSAIIMAENEGEYAEMNEYGCYKIQFLFAPTSAGTDQANSAWVRMATPYAGNQHGMNFPLLKGTEVLVSFLGGNPDRPIIMAAVPNENNPSLRNEKNATQPALRTAGQNTLEFEDRKDQEFARLATPANNAVLHLGSDPKNPEHAGIRMATSAHTGLLSGSYIQEVSGIYRQEIGQQGAVDLDPEPRLALENLQNQRMADFLEEQALLPNATSAQRVKALQAKVKRHDSEAELLNLLLNKKENNQESILDTETISNLKKSIEEKKEKTNELKNIIEKFNNKEIGDDEIKEKIIEEKTIEEKVKEKTTKEEYKEVGHMGMETTYKTNAIINNFLFGINNSVSFALDNTVFGGMKNEASLAGKLNLTIGGSGSINLDKNLIFNLTEANEYTLIKNKVVAKDQELEALKYTIKAVDKTENIVNYSLKSIVKEENIIEKYNINLKGNYNLISKGIGNIKIKKNASELVLQNEKIKLKNSSSTVQVTADGIKAQCGPSSSLSLSIADTKLKGANITINPTLTLRLG